mgnify:FL=1
MAGTFSGQKAPSAIRCIKTLGLHALDQHLLTGCQKAPSAIRCIKTTSKNAIGPSPSSCVRKHLAP